MIVSPLKQKNHGKIQSKIDRSIANASKSDGSFVAINQFYLRLLIRCQSSLNTKKSLAFLHKAAKSLRFLPNSKKPKSHYPSAG
jgi:hypothetical protein